LRAGFFRRPTVPLNGSQPVRAGGSGGLTFVWIVEEVSHLSYQFFRKNDFLEEDGRALVVLLRRRQFITVP
jgi:hypothetical protein